MAEHEAVVIDYSASEKEVRNLRRKVAALERENARVEDSPEAQQVQSLLDLWWREVMGSRKSVAHTLDSTRAPKVRAALKRRRKVDGSDDAAFDMCRRAILGVLHDDWAMGRIKKSRGKSFNDIAEHLLNTDGDIEGFAKLHDLHTGDGSAREALESGKRKGLERTAGNAVKRAGWAEHRVKFGDGMPPWDRVIQALRTAGSSVVAYEGKPDSFKAQCPAHEDRNPSLGVNRASDGRVLLFCRAGCETADVLAALGLAFSDLYEGTDRDHNCLDAPFRSEKPAPSPDLRRLLGEIQSTIAGWDRRAV